MQMQIFLVVIHSIAVANAGICDPVTIKSIIGKITPVFDVTAEDISHMSQPCLKEIIIPGARESVFYASKAEFGYNRAYEYNGLIGTGRRTVYDQILVYFGNCLTRTRAVEVVTGLRRKFTTDILCLYISPEIDHRALGAHVPGGRVTLNIRVDTALCLPGILPVDTNINGSCKPLCNASGMLNDCRKGTMNSVNISKMPTVAVATKATKWHQSTSAEQRSSTRSIQRSSTIRTSSTASSDSSSVTPSIKISTKPTVTVQFKPITANTRTATKTGTAIPMTTYTRSLLSSASTYTNISDNIATVTSPLEITTAHTTSVTHANANIKENVTRPSSTAREQAEGGHDFGLLEGLYIIAGCILLLLLLGILAFFIRRRNIYSSSGGSNTGTALRNGLHWRDNWLVRYHNNEIEEDSISHLEGDIHYIHGNFLNQSNTELHHIHHSDCAEVMKSKFTEDSYDNPWPLVRLDSDFVKNTRSLEKEKSNADKNPVTDIDNRTRDRQAHGRIEEHEQKSVFEEQAKLQEKPSNHEYASYNKHHFHKHVGSPMMSKGKYNIAKVERSNSKNSLKSCQILSDVREDIKRRDLKRTKSESYSNVVEGNKNEVTRQRNSSSMCSECCSTFEEMLKDEIHNIEDAFGMNSNVETESSGSDHGLNKNWRVSTLYAIVSSRNDVSPQEIVLTRKQSSKQHNSAVSRSESYRKVPDSSVSSKETSRSIHRENNYSQRDKFNYDDSHKNARQDLKKVSTRIEGRASSDQNSLSKHIDTQFSEKNVNRELSDIANNNANESESSSTSSENRNTFECIPILQEVSSTFQQNRDKFEQNGSIRQDCMQKSGASGTGQFPKY